MQEPRRGRHGPLHTLRAALVFALSAFLAPVSASGFEAFHCGLPNAVPVARRKNISVDGISMPFGIVPGDWPSARIVANIAGLVASEVMLTARRAA